MDRRYLRQSAGSRSYRVGRSHNRRDREHQRWAQGAGHAGWSFGGRAILDRLPAKPDAAWAARCEAGDFGRA